MGLCILYLLADYKDAASDPEERTVPLLAFNFPRIRKYASYIFLELSDT